MLLPAQTARSDITENDIRTQAYLLHSLSSLQVKHDRCPGIGADRRSDFFLLARKNQEQAHIFLIFQIDLGTFRITEHNLVIQTEPVRFNHTETDIRIVK